MKRRKSLENYSLMPKEYPRTKRLKEMIRHAVAPLLLEAFPQLTRHMITVSEVKVSKDMAIAQIYITMLDDDQKTIDEIIGILNEKVVELRHELAHSVNMRTTPRLRFIYDTSAKYGQRLATAIAELDEDDLQLVEMRFFEKRAFKEIGEILEITENNAKVRLYRVLERLKKILTKK